MMDDLAALRLQLEWGADEALADGPLDRFAAAPAPRPIPQSLDRPRSWPAIGAVAPAPARPGPTSLDELYAELDAFGGCALRATATHTVRPDGNPVAGLIVIGEAPGSDDDRSGRAFSGPAGAVLDLVLGSIGFDRTRFLATTLVPWRPPGGRKLSDAEIQACLPFLLRLLGLLRPRRLLLLGAVPVRTLAGGNESIRRLRGRWIDVKAPEIPAPIAALALPPLDQWLRNVSTKQDLWNDLMQLMRAVTTD